MGSLAAQPLPAIGAVRIVLDIRDFTDVADEVQLIRSTAAPDSGEFYEQASRVRVRPTYDLFTEYPSMGFPWEMTAGGVDVWYDSEAPLNTPVWYQAELPGADTAFIYSQAAVLLLDTGFESGITGWTADAGGTLSANTTTPIDGTTSLRLTSTGGTATIGARSTITPVASVVPGRMYAFEATLRAGAAETDLRIAVDWYDAAGVFAAVDFHSVASLPAGVAQRHREVFEAPLLSSRAQFRIRWGGTPAAARFVDVDDVSILDLGDVDEPSTPVTLTVDGAGWLSDPELPAGDVRLDLLPSDECVTPAGVVFLSHDADTRAGVGSRYDVVDQAAPAIVTGRRKLPTSAVTLAALSFADRDRLHELLATGNQLLLRLVDEYGIADRYLDVGDVKTDALSPDLRLPYRVLDLPYAQSSSPTGPTAGVLGTRFGDLDRYATWDEFDAANLTSIDLLLGAGSTLGLGA